MTNLPQYERLVKQMVIIVYINTYLGKYENLDEMIDKLNRIFKHKQKVFANLAKYVEKQVSKGRKPEDAANDLTFFAGVLHDFAYKNVGQPIH